MVGSWFWSLEDVRGVKLSDGVHKEDVPGSIRGEELRLDRLTDTPECLRSGGGRMKS